MNKLLYLLTAAALSTSFVACDDDDIENIGTLEGIGMVERSASVQDGQIVRARRVSNISVVYNNLIALDPSKPVTVNGQTVDAAVNPDNGMELLIPVSLIDNADYTLDIPDGAIYRADDSSIRHEGKHISFSTKIGIDNSLVAQSLTNPNATAEAKAVYQYLLDNYGTKTLSGAMADQYWGNGYFDYLSTTFGKSPKVAGFDFGHLPYSPANWIDYGDITPVVNLHNKGCIVTVNWHWVVPGKTNGHMWVEYEDPENKDESKQVHKEMPDDWSGNIQLPASLFAFAQEGDVLTVNIKDVADDAQGSLKNGVTWGGITETKDIDGTPTEVSYEYFDLVEHDENGEALNSPTEFELTLTPSILSVVKSDGLIISGHGYTVTTVDFSGGVNGSELAYNNEFDPEQVITAGTAQNAIAEADVQKLAGYMKLLQDAGIPVLFRPFHEAAGDYTYGAWFWWGNKGVDVTKKLWIWLHDKLTNEYGLNNLIWVWTMQTSDNGQLADVSKLKEAYPGDNYVDIVGADLYEDALSNQSARFDLVNAAVGRTKMVALCECGNLLDVNESTIDNAMWSYFMSWYDNNPKESSTVWGPYNWNAPIKTVDENGNQIMKSPWEVVLNNPLIINAAD